MVYILFVSDWGGSYRTYVKLDFRPSVYIPNRLGTSFPGIGNIFPKRLGTVLPAAGNNPALSFNVVG